MFTKLKNQHFYLFWIGIYKQISINYNELEIIQVVKKLAYQNMIYHFKGILIIVFDNM